VSFALLSPLLLIRSFPPHIIGFHTRNLTF
jgi:hypothetical protein